MNPSQINDQGLIDLVYTGLVHRLGGEEKAQELVKDALADIAKAIEAWTENDERREAMMLALWNFFVRSLDALRQGIDLAAIQQGRMTRKIQ